MTTSTIGTQTAQSPWRRSVTHAQLFTPEERAAQRRQYLQTYMITLRWGGFLAIAFTIMFALAMPAPGEIEYYGGVTPEWNSETVTIYPMIDDCRSEPAPVECGFVPPHSGRIDRVLSERWGDQYWAD